MNKLNLTWAIRLLRAKFFVLLTDKDSVISLKGVDPQDFTDMVALSSQEAAIAEFSDKLADLRQRHEAAVQAYLNKGRENKKREATTKTTTSRDKVAEPSNKITKPKKNSGGQPR